MSDYIRVMKNIFRQGGRDYYIYLGLCTIEVGRNIAFLLSTYWGVAFITQQASHSEEYLLWSMLSVVSCELAVVILNFFMNRAEERLEGVIYRDLLNRSCDISLELLQKTHFQSLFRDVLEEGMVSMTTLAVNFSLYFQFFCNILIFFIIASRAGWIFVLVSFGSIVIANVYRSRSEKQIELDRKELSFYRNERKYFEDILDKEQNHVEIVAQQITPYVVDRSESAYANFINKGNEVKRNNLRYHRRGTFIIGVGAFFSVLLLFFRSEVTGLNKSHSFVILVSMVLMYQEMKHFLTTLSWDKNALYYSKKYLEFMDLTEREAKENSFLNQESRLDSVRSIEEVRLHGVTLKYGKRIAIDEVTHTFRRGLKVLLVGENGSGKTSLLCLLAGLYRPSGGYITDLGEHEFSAGFLKTRVAYVSQSFPMLSISVRESFLSDKVTDDEMWMALEKVELIEKVRSSPFGLDSIVGKDVAFSKGQWQRFAIARLLVQKEKDIWILDEPTSAINAIYEEKILKSVLREGNDKILVIVSHRLGLAHEMDEIIHIENGKIRCCGDHQHLMLHDSRYKDLFELQKDIYQQLRKV